MSCQGKMPRNFHHGTGTWSPTGGGWGQFCPAPGQRGGCEKHAPTCRRGWRAGSRKDEKFRTPGPYRGCCGDSLDTSSVPTTFHWLREADRGVQFWRPPPTAAVILGPGWWDTLKSHGGQILQSNFIPLSGENYWGSLQLVTRPQVGWICRGNGSSTPPNIIRRRLSREGEARDGFITPAGGSSLTLDTSTWGTHFPGRGGKKSLIPSRQEQGSPNPALGKSRKQLVPPIPTAPFCARGTGEILLIKLCCNLRQRPLYWRMGGWVAGEALGSQAAAEKAFAVPWLSWGSCPKELKGPLSFFPLWKNQKVIPCSFYMRSNSSWSLVQIFRDPLISGTP